jgi:hypothetical protein
MLSAAVYPPFHIGTAAKRRKKKEKIHVAITKDQKGSRNI